MIKREEIERRVAAILREHEVETPPVPIEQILAKKNVIIIPLPASEDVSGAIVRKGTNTVIALNPKHAPTRQRFTLAHEFAHLQLHEDVHEHVDADLKISWRNTKSAQAVDWREIEANQFAAELLMPQSFLKRDLDVIGELDRNKVRLLAQRYNVSNLAMEIRMVNLGLIPLGVSFFADPMP